MSLASAMPYIVGGGLMALGGLQVCVWHRAVNVMSRVIAGFGWACVFYGWFAPDQKSLSFENMGGADFQTTDFARAALYYYTFIALFASSAGTMGPLTVSFAFAQMTLYVARRAVEEIALATQMALFFVLFAFTVVPLLLYRSFVKGTLPATVGSIMLGLGLDVFVQTNVAADAVESAKHLDFIYSNKELFINKPDAGLSKGMLVLVPALTVALIVGSCAARVGYKIYMRRKIAMLEAELQAEEMLMAGEEQEQEEEEGEEMDEVDQIDEYYYAQNHPMTRDMNRQPPRLRRSQQPQY